MDDLATVAFEFCRECMGWDGAKLSMWGPHSNSMIVAKRGRSVVNRLRFTDLTAVMKAVQGWCDTHGTKEHPLTCSLSYNWHGEYLGEICDWMEPLHDRTVSPSPCHALLAACVEASRKLKVA